MGVLAADSCWVLMQEGALTADAGPHQLYLAHQAGGQYAAPMHKCLQAALHAEHQQLEPAATSDQAVDAALLGELQVSGSCEAWLPPLCR